MDDFPAVGKFAENDGEQAVGSCAVGHGEMVFTADESGVRAERLDAEIREFQFAHVVPRARVGGAVVVEGLLPSAIFVAAREECQVGGVPVSGHEGLEIVTIPGVLLGVEDGGDGGGLVGGRGCGLRGGGDREREDEQEFHESPFGSVPL